MTANQSHENDNDLTTIPFFIFYYIYRAFFRNWTPPAVQNWFDLNKSCLGLKFSKFYLVFRTIGRFLKFNMAD